MQNSKDQLIRVMTLGLVFGALLFILAAEVNHLKSSQESEEDDATIYIQEDGVTAVVINESSADSESGIITPKDEKFRIDNCSRCRSLCCRGFHCKRIS